MDRQDARSHFEPRILIEDPDLYFYGKPYVVVT